MTADVVAPARPFVALRPGPTPAPETRPCTPGRERSTSAQALAAIAERLRPHVVHLTPAELDALVEAVFLEGARAGAAWVEE